MDIINVEEGQKRVMNNKKLFLKLLSAFKGRHMAEQLIASAEKGDLKSASEHAHALKGVSANLSMHKLTGVIEQVERQLGTSGNLAAYAPDLMQAVAEVEEMIAELVEVG